MPCRQVSTFNGTPASSGSYRTEAECNQACREGACCEGTTCSVKPQCQCQGTGKTFKGVGTVCTPNPCGFSCNGCRCAFQVTLAGVSIPVDGKSYFWCYSSDSFWKEEWLQSILADSSPGEPGFFSLVRDNLVNNLRNNYRYLLTRVAATPQCVYDPASGQYKSQVELAVYAHVFSRNPNIANFVPGQTEISTSEFEFLYSTYGAPLGVWSGNSRVFQFGATAPCGCASASASLKQTNIRFASSSDPRVLLGWGGPIDLCGAAACLAEFFPCSWSQPTITSSCECDANPLP